MPKRIFFDSGGWRERWEVDVASQTAPNTSWYHSVPVSTTWYHRYFFPAYRQTVQVRGAVPNAATCDRRSEIEREIEKAKANGGNEKLFKSPLLVGFGATFGVAWGRNFTGQAFAGCLRWPHGTTNSFIPMDLIFKCPKCNQELEVDASGAGEEIDCPSCGERIRIPAQEPESANAEAFRSHVPGTSAVGHEPIKAMASSAAAKVEMHLKVPVHTGRTKESLIAKPLAPLEVAAKQSDRQIRAKSIRRIECVEVGHDKFDEVVTNFLAKVGEANILNVLPLAYTHLDISSQKVLTDYGVLIIYKG